MGKLSEYIKSYFATTTDEQLRQDWEELMSYNIDGPDILDVINNYVKTQSGVDFSDSCLTEDYTNSDTDLCQAA